MKTIGPTSRHFKELSRRDFVWTGGAGFAAALLSTGFVGLAIKPSRGLSRAQGSGRHTPRMRTPDRTQCYAAGTRRNGNWSVAQGLPAVVF